MPFQPCGYRKRFKNGFNNVYNVYEVFGDLKGIKFFLFNELYVCAQRLMVSFAKDVYILLEFVEIIVMELHFCKVVCYIDIFFKQVV